MNSPSSLRKGPEHVGKTCQNQWTWGSNWALALSALYLVLLFFSPLFIIILRLIWKVMIKCCQKAYRRGGKASIIVFWHFWHQRFLWRKEKKETKQNLFSQDSSAFCFLWLRKIRLQRGWCYRTKACLPSRSLSELCFHLKAIFTEICSPVKWVFTL